MILLEECVIRGAWVGPDQSYERDDILLRVRMDYKEFYSKKASPSYSLQKGLNTLGN